MANKNKQVHNRTKLIAKEEHERSSTEPGIVNIQQRPKLCLCHLFFLFLAFSGLFLAVSGNKSSPAARRDRARAVDAPASQRLAARAAAAGAARRGLPSSCCLRRRCEPPPAPATPPCGRSPPPWRSRSPCPPPARIPAPPQLLPAPASTSQALEAVRVVLCTHPSNTALIKQVLWRSKRLGGGAGGRRPQDLQSHARMPRG